MSSIHSIFFKRNEYKLIDVIEFLKKHNFKPLKIHITDKFIKVRLTKPNKYKYDYRTKRINKYINFVIEFLK